MNFGVASIILIHIHLSIHSFINMNIHIGNTHPKFFGWVHGSGLPMAIGADLVASTMNCNLGGRNQGATEIERAVVEFAVQVVGLFKGTLYDHVLMIIHHDAYICLYIYIYIYISLGSWFTQGTCLWNFNEW